MKQQAYVEISRDIKKRPHDDEDSYGRKNKEDVAAEIERLKRPRVGDV